MFTEVSLNPNVLFINLTISHAGKKEREALQRQLDEKISANNSSTTNTTSSSSFSSNWEAECNSLKLVLEIR